MTDGDLSGVGPWFDDPDTRRWVGDRDWPSLVLGLSSNPPRKSQGRSVVGRFAWIANAGGLPVGVADVETYADATASLALVVDPARRREGMGRAIIQAVVDRPELEKVGVLSVGVHAHNHASILFFGSLGFALDSDAADEEGYRTLTLQIDRSGRLVTHPPSHRPTGRELGRRVGRVGDSIQHSPEGALTIRPGRASIHRLAAARSISNTGSWAATVALSLVIYARTGSTLWLSASFFFTAGLGALAAPLAGVIADRFDRKRVMIGCDALGAGAYVAMAFVQEPAALIALGSAATLLHAPFGPASSAATPNLVSADDLGWANGILSAAGNVGNALGPLIGGALVAAVRARPVFLLNAGSFLFSAALIATVQGRFRAPAQSQTGHQSGWAAGARFLLKQPVLLTLTAVGAVTFIASEVTWVADLPLIRLFDVGGTGYGVMMTAWGLGLLLGSLVAARLVREATEQLAAVVGTLVFGAFITSIGLVRWFPLVPASLFLVGLADSFAVVGFTGLYQRRSPDAIRGRMFAAIGGVFALATALGFSVAGFIVAATGPRPVYVVGGLIDVGAAVLLGVALRRPVRLRSAARTS